MGLQTPVLLKGLLKRTLAKFGFYVGRFPQASTLDRHLLHLFSVLRINCVLDVGAHYGEFGTLLRELGYQGRIVSFEPVPENFSALTQCGSNDKGWLVYPFALGAQESSASMRVTGSSHFCSFCPPSTYGEEQFGDKMKITRDQLVTVRRLDTLFDECVAGIAAPQVFLKMDTQGFDLEVIKGAGDKLNQIQAIQTELSAKPIYDQMGTALADGIAALQQHGFDLTGFFPVTWDRSDMLRVIEFDCVLCRAAHQMHMSGV